MKTVLTIAGSDCSGGAGIQADIKTLMAHGVYSMSAITALTAQNTTGVTGIMAVEPDFLAKQLDAVFTDIRPDAVKIGMLPTTELVRVVVDKCQEYQPEHIVVDPVMVSTSGSKLIDKSARELLCRKLFPLAEVVTPNIPEAEVIAGREIRTSEDMEMAARIICAKYRCSVLCKGGHAQTEADDYLYMETGGVWYRGDFIDTHNTHGTGCTLSSAIAANLAKDFELDVSVSFAKDYVAGALADGLDLGHGNGPLNHAYRFCSSAESE